MPLLPDIIDDTISIEAVDREIAAGFRRLCFTPPIEQAFQRDSLAPRQDLFSLTALPTIVLYDAFLVTDWFALHDMFPQMVVARLGIFTPVILTCLAISRRCRCAAHLEWIAVFGASLAVLLPMTAMIFSTSPGRLSYQYGSVLVMLSVTAVQRLRFRNAVIGLTVMFCEQIVAVLQLSNDFTIEATVSIVTFFATACVLLAMGAFCLEQADRRSYLFRLRAGLLHGQLATLARTDSLTGLSNRRHLGTVSAEIESGIVPRSISAILIDIDHFKAFNDTQGHVEGDACLRRISACIAAAVSASGGHAFRYGGEEMMILLDGADLHDARRVAETVRTAIRAEAIAHPALGEGAVVTASLGIACGPVPEARITDLIAAADTALYAAKHAGRNQVWPPLRAPSVSTGGRIAA